MNRIEACICFSTEILIMPSKGGQETRIFGNGTPQVSVGPERPVKEDHPWSWTTSTGKFLCRPKRSIYFSTEISEYFDIRKAPSSRPNRRIPQCLRQRSISHVFHHCVLTTKRSSYFVESMISPEIKRGEVIATCYANVYSFLLARHLTTNAPYPTSCSSWL